jgi:glutathione synthase
MKLGVVMDPIEKITVKKDSTFAMLLAAQHRDWQISYMELGDIFLNSGNVFAKQRQISVTDDPDSWFKVENESIDPLDDLDVILMRKDPPFDMEYIYATYLLEFAQKKGVKVINNPQSLRDANEKLYTCHFPQCAPPTLVTRRASDIRDFLEQHGDIILKPLDGMGGTSIFRIHSKDHNISVIIESLTDYENRFVMAQTFIPEIETGDKRILMINGVPVDYALARIPAKGETRGNLAAGGTGKGVELTERDRWICSEVAPVLKAKGLYFVGLDVIGDYLTEVNVTSPTCIRELDRIYELDIAGDLMDCIESL